MKQALGTLLIVVFLSFQARAQAFLTYEQFQSLSRAQQNDYIQAVQQFAVLLDESPWLSVDQDRSGKWDLFLPSFLPAAYAEEDALRSLCTVRSAQHYTREEFISKLQSMNQCFFTRVNNSPAYRIPESAESIEVLAHELKRRIESGQLNAKNYELQEAVGALNVAIDDFRKIGTREGGDFSYHLDPASQIISEVKSQFSGSRRQSPSSSRKSSNAKSQQEPAVSAVNPSQKVSNPASARTAFQARGYQCLNAGFLIPREGKNKCEFQSSLPEDFGFSFLNRKQFNCASPKPVLCNPLLFGYESKCKTGEVKPCRDVKPLCIAPNAHATQACFELSKKLNTLAEVRSLWSSDGGEKAYTEYITHLKGLCDANLLDKRPIRPAAKTDIKKTCAVAYEALRFQVQSKVLPGSVVPGDSESSSQK